MNTRPRPAPPGGVLMSRTLTVNDATTLTLNVAEQPTEPDHFLAGF